MARSRNNKLTDFFQGPRRRVVLIDALAFSERVDYCTTDEVDVSVLSSDSTMKRRQSEVDVQRNDFPFDGLILPDVIEFDKVQGRVGYFEKMKKRFSFEVIVHLYSK
jgi:hypothetical protein